VGGLHPVSSDASRVLLFVGGVGASPALAIVHQMIDLGLRVPTTVVYAVRDVDEFTMLDERLLAEACR
jgi:ferredoxin-NADP reductase